MSFPPSAEPWPDVNRVLCVYAHPDDVDFSAAGTVARWISEGLDVAYTLVTRGDAGGFDATPRDQMPILREAEQRAAAAAVGVTDVTSLDGYHDGTVMSTLELRRDISAAIRRFRPDRVLTHSPLRRWERLAGPSHPDHLAVGDAATSAVYPDSRNEFAFPELLAAGLEPWTVREIWYSGGPFPDYPVDITDVYDKKLAALRAHATQVSHVDIEGFLRERLETTARETGLADGRLAEAYTIVRTAY